MRDDGTSSTGFPSLRSQSISISQERRRQANERKVVVPVAKQGRDISYPLSEPGIPDLQPSTTIRPGLLDKRKVLR